MAFYNRRHELALLDDLYRREAGQMVVVYGRRRVGKTMLLTHWLKARGHPAFFWTADRSSPNAQLRAFSRAWQAYRNPGATPAADFTYGTWETAWREIALAAERERLVVVLDEFTYLLEADPTLASVLQRLWDHHLKARNLFLVLTGSHAGMIEREILAYRSPLYNRASGSLHLAPLPFGVLSAFFPNYTAVERATVYACVGGIPQYLELLSPAQPLETNLQSLLSSHLLLDDAGVLLRDQLQEPRNYVAIVEALAAGFTRSTDMAKLTGMQTSSIGKYLVTLQRLGIVAREVPATESRPERSKKARYRISDHYLRFYYRFLAPARAHLERGLTQQTWFNLRQHLPEFVGTHVFEELCREYILRQADAGKLLFVPRRVGSFWGTGLPQIDVVAINEDAHQLILGECKWTATPLDAGVVTSLLERGPRILPGLGSGWQVTYAFFSRSGFAPDARPAAKGVAAMWVSLEHLDGVLRES